jgi:hypothetical protein
LAIQIATCVAACQGWGSHGGPLAVAQMSEAIRKDSSVDVRLAAGRALGQLGGDDAVAALRPALDDPDPALQYRAMQSLREITGKDFGDNVVSWREYIRGEAARPGASERMGSKRSEASTGRRVRPTGTVPRLTPTPAILLGSSYFSASIRFACRRRKLGDLAQG